MFMGEALETFNNTSFWMEKYYWRPQYPIWVDLLNFPQKNQITKKLRGKSIES
jgi:hypothetical protein